MPLNLSKQRACQQVVNFSDSDVPSECLEIIFGSFYKTDKARMREVDSFGLGQSLCKQQITAIGVTIVAKCTAFSGLDIVMILPAKSEAVVM